MAGAGGVGGEVGGTLHLLMLCGGEIQPKVNVWHFITTSKPVACFNCVCSWSL